MNLDITAEELSEGLNENLLRLEDRWILSALNRTIREVNDKLSNYVFDQAALQAYDFFWKEFCAYYVEISKPVLFGKAGTPEDRKNKQKLLTIILSQSLRLLHPMAPFITEELFQRLKDRFAGVKVNDVDPYTQETITALLQPACIVAAYPQVIRESDIDLKIEETFKIIEEIVYAIRNIRGEVKLPPGTATDVHLIGIKSDPHFQSVQDNTKLISALVRTEQILFHETDPHLPHSATTTANSLKIVIPIPADLIEKERVRLAKEKERLEVNLDKMRKQLSNADFINRAPEALINQHKEKLLQAEEELASIRLKLKTFV